MKRHLILIVPLAALMVFMAVQIYMIDSIWKQKEEILLMRYKSLSREGLSMLMAKKKVNGFEKAMEVTDKFAQYLISEEMSKITSPADSSSIRKLALKEIYAILSKNEKLTPFLQSYIAEAGYEKDFKPGVFINNIRFLTPAGSFSIVDTILPLPRKNILIINVFREEHNNFNIEYGYVIDLTHKNEMVFKEAFFSFSLIVISIFIVFMVFWLTWRNLLEERRLSELKSDFINNMTHELKTPLSTITVAGRTLEKEQVISDRERVLATAKMISKQSVHLNQLINTILEVSLLERTEFELDRHKVNADELVHQVVSSFLTSCDGCAKIEENYGANGTLMSVDIVYFTTVINNLLTNAVKYCDKDPVIMISTQTEGNDYIISVADNGVGVSKEHIDHIFEKFYRVPYGNIHKTKGLGLGLYYVRRIVTAHGGDVSVSSRAGRGTTFKIRIPI